MTGKNWVSKKSQGAALQAEELLSKIPKVRMTLLCSGTGRKACVARGRVLVGKAGNTVRCLVL